MDNRSLRSNECVPTLRVRSFQATISTTIQLLFLIAITSLPGLAQTVKDVFTFTSATLASFPQNGAPAQGHDGRLYVTTSGLGISNGSIDRLQIGGTGSVLYAFNGLDGATPTAGLILGSDGRYYGTTALGGTASLGVLFRIAPNGTYSVLHEFSGGIDGSLPLSAPIEASDGSLYGSTAQLDASGFGTVYRYSPSGVFTTIFQFDSTNGKEPVAPPIQAADGLLYGTTLSGGLRGCGSIYKLTTTGILRNTYDAPCPGSPFGPLMQASDGNLYGTMGSTGGHGSVFTLSASGVVATLHLFSGGTSDGNGPAAGLVQGTDQALYGSTQTGGTYDNGTLYKITTSGVYTLLYSFPSNIGSQPLAAMLQDTNGIFYGTTSLGGSSNLGVVYSLDVGLGPFIALRAYQGKVGSAVQILGQGFTGATNVTFNGMAASGFQVVSDTYMTAVVPSGATSGSVVVTTTTGALTSNKTFTVVQ